MNARRSFSWLLLAAALGTLGCGSEENDDDLVSVGGRGESNNQADAAAGEDSGSGDAGANPDRIPDASSPDPDEGLDAFPSLDSGLPLPDAASDAGDTTGMDGVGCFAAKSEQVLSAAAGGDCQQPIEIDLSAASYGDVSELQLPRSPGDLPIGARDKCGLQTGSDLVLRVQLPPDADLEAAVDRGGAGAVLRVFESSSDPCGSTPIACTDESDGSSCTYMRVTQTMLGQTNASILVLSEVVDSGLPWTLLLRVQDPRTGS